MSARNGLRARVLEALADGPATAVDLAARLDVPAVNVADCLAKLEDLCQVGRAGIRPTGGRAAIIWRLPLAALASIPASNSDEFVARGGVIEVLPGFNPVPPARRPVREVHRGRGGL